VFSGRASDGRKERLAKLLGRYSQPTAVRVRFVRLKLSPLADLPRSVPGHRATCQEVRAFVPATIFDNISRFRGRMPSMRRLSVRPSLRGCMTKLSRGSDGVF